MFLNLLKVLVLFFILPFKFVYANPATNQLKETQEALFQSYTELSQRLIKNLESLETEKNKLNDEVQKLQSSLVDTDAVKKLNAVLYEFAYLEALSPLFDLLTLKIEEKTFHNQTAANNYTFAEADSIFRDECLQLIKKELSHLYKSSETPFLLQGIMRLETRMNQLPQRRLSGPQAFLLSLQPHAQKLLDEFNKLKTEAKQHMVRARYEVIALVRAAEKDDALVQSQFADKLKAILANIEKEHKNKLDHLKVETETYQKKSEDARSALAGLTQTLENSVTELQSLEEKKLSLEAKIIELSKHIADLESVSVTADRELQQKKQATLLVGNTVIDNLVEKLTQGTTTALFSSTVPNEETDTLKKQIVLILREELLRFRNNIDTKDRDSNPNLTAEFVLRSIHSMYDYRNLNTPTGYELRATVIISAQVGIYKETFESKEHILNLSLKGNLVQNDFEFNDWLETFFKREFFFLIGRAMESEREKPSRNTMKAKIILETCETLLAKNNNPEPPKQESSIIEFLRRP